MRIYLVLSIIIYVLTFITLNGCYLDGTKNNDSSVEKGNYLKEIYVVSFKSWLKDTLALINEKQDLLGFKGYQVYVSNDSLSLEITKQYELGINSQANIKQNNVILNVIALLEEYNEKPKHDFNLSFITKECFYPSASSELVYDYLFEIKNLQVIKFQPEIISTYSYIRGRLNDKKDITKVNGKEEITYYNFVWEGTKLVKKKR